MLLWSLKVILARILVSPPVYQVMDSAVLQELRLLVSNIVWFGWIVLNAARF